MGGIPWSETWLHHALVPHAAHFLVPGKQAMERFTFPRRLVKIEGERIECGEPKMIKNHQTTPVAVMPNSRTGDPTWEVAGFYPVQGEWTEADYLALPTNHLVELSDGCLEVLPMPKHFHQLIVAYLFKLLDAFVTTQGGGTALFAPLPVHLWQGKYREPDVLYMRPENAHRIHDYWEGADLVMEVVSPGKAEHDRETKRREYALAGIPEYWIVDVLQEQILVLVLQGKEYRVHGQFGRGTQATSVLLPGFSVSCDHVLALAATEKP
jgi:Uma2 family endonuclease